MSGRLQNKTALITGGGTGIGAVATRRVTLFPACNDSSCDPGQTPTCNHLPVLPATAAVQIL